MNINAVIAHLIEMTPGQRKQFAQLHMDDPMMLSAAKFVDNQVTKQAQSLAAQAIGAAPPPVNQQVVEQMSPQQPQATQQLPEDVGIAQLPAPNMEKVVRAAGGGIVAFNGETGSQVKIKNVLGQEIDPGTGYPVVPPYRRAIEAFKDWQEMTDNFARPTNSGPHPRNMPIKDTASAKPAAPSAPATLPSTGAGGGQGNRGTTSTSPERAIQATQPPQGGSRTAPFSQAPQKESSEKSVGLEALLKGYQDAQGPAVDPYAAQHEESRKSREQMALDEMAGAKERQAGIEKLLSGKEARIAKREERLNQQDDVNLNMSLINAGLSMMQSTGKGLAGIAEGAQKGLGQYTEGLKMSEAARQKIEDARDAHDELRFNLNNMSSKEIQAAKRSMEEGKIASTNEAITAIMHKEGLNRADATALFAARVNQMAADKQMAHAEKLNALSIAASAGNAAASRDLQRELAKMPDANQRFYASLSPTGNVREGYKFAMEARGEGTVDKAALAVAKDIVANAFTKEQKSSPEYIAAQQLIMNSLSGSRLNNLPSVPSINIPQTNPNLINRSQ